MEQLVNFQGLNCYYNSVVSIANEMGIGYEPAFSNLWSETDFRFEESGQTYASDRICGNLALLGCRRQTLFPQETLNAEEALLRVPAGEYFVVGMDSYSIPWNDIYLLRHGRHCFIARRGELVQFECFDPTYGKRDLWLSGEEIAASAFEISRLVRCKRDIPGAKRAFDLNSELSQVQKALSIVEENLTGMIGEAAGGNAESGLRAARYADALVSNRLLFRRYLCGLPKFETLQKSFMPLDYFLVWSAVKNGCFKLSVGGGGKFSDQIQKYLFLLLKRESEFAQRALETLRSL